MAKNIEVTGVTVKINGQLVCLTIEDARILLRELNNVIKEDNPIWRYQESFTLSPDPWTDLGPNNTWEIPTTITVTSE